MRYVAPTEFIRQAKREMRRYQRNRLERYEVHLVDGKPILHQVIHHLAATTSRGFTQTGQYAHDSVALDAQYDFWQLGRSRIEQLLSLEILQKRKARAEAEAKRANDELLGAAGERLEWALNKDMGNGIHS